MSMILGPRLCGITAVETWYYGRSGADMERTMWEGWQCGRSDDLGGLVPCGREQEP